MPNTGFNLSGGITSDHVLLNFYQATTLTLSGSLRSSVLAPFAAVIVWRLLDEETFLEQQLPGYAAYRGRTRYRLIPFVW